MVGLTKYHDAIYEQLKTLRDFTVIINSTLDLDELMNLVMEKAKAELQAEACSILFYNPKTNKLEFEVALCNDPTTCEILKEKVYIELGQGIAGWAALHQQPLYIDDVQKDERFYREADKLTGFTTKSIIAVPLIGRRGLIGVAEIINPARKDYDREIFSALCKQFAIAIENALLFKESIERQRLKQELEIAASIQSSFLPENPTFERGPYSVRALNIPAYSIGGDFYDFIDLPNQRAGVLIGDISGKGVSAALYMAKVISDFRHLSLKYNNLSATMSHLNSIISKAPMGIFVTAIYMTFHIESDLIEYVNAGHPPFIKIESSGTVEAIDDVSGPPLGLATEGYEPSNIKMKQGDRLILLTDGAIDTKDSRGSYLGYQELLTYVRQRASSDRLIDLLAERAKGLAKFNRSDDITIIEIKWR